MKHNVTSVEAVLTLHDSQYGQLKGSMELDTAAMRKDFERVAKERILGGSFAKEFTALDTDGPGVEKKLEELYDKASQSELAEGEKRVRDRLGLRTI
jgi:ketol-acid reductoisomerase